jgi:lipopolysaccharide/colanic/teichoic acid biosynthesis glycosyltransferase
MHAAVPALDVNTTLTGGKKRRDSARVSLHPGVIEIPREIHPFALADLAVEREAVAEVFPAERSEQVCRALNVTVALVAMVVLSPVYLLVALAVWLSSPGPVIYSQVRVGVDRRYGRKGTHERRATDHGGKPFMMYKFRSMRVDAEKNGQAVWAMKRDPRVTLVGRVLRRTRLDELPQLYNVLRGDMNIVGPRPERPTIFADLRATIPEYPMRQRVKPGITGWAQINQSYDACVDDVRKKVKYDLEYVQRQSVIEDLRIMSMTVPVMLFGRGGW